nr:MAG TPA: protein of unknown function (DUF2828) [Caudoviricetes sp.]
MSSFVQAVNIHNASIPDAYSGKGDPALSSIGTPLSDVYASMGALRNNPEGFLGYFEKLVLSNPEEALSCLFKLRDIRGGVGERNLFRLGLKRLEKVYEVDNTIIDLILDYGRADDLWLSFEYRKSIDAVVNYIADLVKEVGKEGHSFEARSRLGLIAKWLPRSVSKNKQHTHQTRYLLSKLRSKLQMTPSLLRTELLSYSSTVEQKMSAKKWDEINYNHVPSQAMHKLKNAFKRNDEERFTQYVEDLSEGKEGVKVNAATLYPYQLMNYANFAYYKNSIDNNDAIIKRALHQSQWDALPNWLENLKAKVLPVIDVSGSMNTKVAGNITAMDIAISLGWYVASKQTGPLKGLFMSFSDDPKLSVGNSDDHIYDIYQGIRSTDWGYGTNFANAMRVLLSFKEAYNVNDEDMPDVLLVLSDMNFDDNFYNLSGLGGSKQSVISEMRDLAAAKNVKLPKIVFWNLDHNGTFVCKDVEEGCCEVSGFNPSSMVDVITNLDNLNATLIAHKAIQPYLDKVQGKLTKRNTEQTFDTVYTFRKGGGMRYKINRLNKEVATLKQAIENK